MLCGIKLGIYETHLFNRYPRWASWTQKILQETDADLYFFSGDIIYKAFFSYDRIIDFCGVQEELLLPFKRTKG